MYIRKYQLPDGKLPFDIWLNRLRDKRAKAKILIRLKRLELGNLGDVKPVTNGVHELRINEGQGYRIYFGMLEREIVLLLCGGSKPTQQRDIKQALQYWSHYNAK
ncbi:MAG: type II toxin-antitoxin system RelE/ParE family toxin [Gammaproteobacteria bacterium]|nr:type II toxin-antitoxin system RelE/ParE family toxin [Gammaproteobacteria bacterium]